MRGHANTAHWSCLLLVGPFALLYRSEGQLLRSRREVALALALDAPTGQEERVHGVFKGGRPSYSLACAANAPARTRGPPSFASASLAGRRGFSLLTQALPGLGEADGRLQSAMRATALSLHPSSGAEDGVERARSHSTLAGLRSHVGRDARGPVIQGARVGRCTRVQAGRARRRSRPAADRPYLARAGWRAFARRFQRSSPLGPPGESIPAIVALPRAPPHPAAAPAAPGHHQPAVLCVVP